MTPKAGRSISSQGSKSKTMKSIEHILARLGVILFGFFVGALATFIHFALVPFGLIVALVGSFVCALLIRSRSGSRVNILLFAIAWTLVVYRGASNEGEELLIMANTPGYTLLYLGPVLVFLPSLLPSRRQHELPVSGLE